ncbi:MAG: PD-(D/E)XK nuclease family protein [Leptolyngbyaceae cyanobacterium bins.302]|nr:PD-(D/E)XK nuclease family protein [Leptolyngbyaceae cyanobacterium bins.302]
MLRLSQGHLSLLAMCPRKFQHVVLDQMGSPEDIDQQARLQQGARFHLLLQQWLLQLPVEPIVQADLQLQQWFAAFKEAAPRILAAGEQQAESDRLLELDGYLLTVRYDLLITGDDYAKILDWKTYPRPQKTQRLEQHWQTRLYPFVLAETSAYLPEQIAMVYWFFQSDRESSTPQSLTLQYNSHKHEATRQELTHLLAQLTHHLERFQMGEPLPQLGWGSRPCEECAFAPRCGRGQVDADGWLQDGGKEEAQGDRLPDLLTLAEIEEVPL